MRRNLALYLMPLAIFTGTLGFAEGQDTASQLFQTVNALKQQQTEIADNQTKSDQKIADLAEKIRVARLFMSRAGGKHKPLSLNKPAPP